MIYPAFFAIVEVGLQGRRLWHLNHMICLPEIFVHCTASQIGIATFTTSFISFQIPNADNATPCQI